MASDSAKSPGSDDAPMIAGVVAVDAPMIAGVVAVDAAAIGWGIDMGARGR